VDGKMISICGRFRKKSKEAAQSRLFMLIALCYVMVYNVDQYYIFNYRDNINAFLKPIDFILFLLRIKNDIIGKQVFIL
jgi:hypothetical protein